MYVKLFNPNMAYGISTRLGAEISTSGELLSGNVEEGSAVMSGINALQDTLNQMQTTLNTLAGETVSPVSSATTPAATTPAVTPIAE